MQETDKPLLLAGFLTVLAQVGRKAHWQEASVMSDGLHHAGLLGGWKVSQVLICGGKLFFYLMAHLLSLGDF